MDFAVGSPSYGTKRYKRSGSCEFSPLRKKTHADSPAASPRRYASSWAKLSSYGSTMYLHLIIMWENTPLAYTVIDPMNLLFHTTAPSTLFVKDIFRTPMDLIHWFVDALRKLYPHEEYRIEAEYSKNRREHIVSPSVVQMSYPCKIQTSYTPLALLDEISMGLSTILHHEEDMSQRFAYHRPSTHEYYQEMGPVVADKLAAAYQRSHPSITTNLKKQLACAYYKRAQGDLCTYGDTMFNSIKNTKPSFSSNTLFGYLSCTGRDSSCYTLTIPIPFYKIK